MKTIFLAEDSPHDAKFFTVALEALHQQYSLHHLYDGVELLDHLKNQEKAPDLIFLDINMPRKSGYDALVEIRSSEQYREIPVIIFSTSELQMEIERMHQAGATLYVRKPDNFSAWKGVIEKAISTVYVSGQRKFTLEHFFIK